MQINIQKIARCRNCNWLSRKDPIVLRHKLTLALPKYNYNYSAILTTLDRFVNKNKQIFAILLKKSFVFAFFAVVKGFF